MERERKGDKAGARTSFDEAAMAFSEVTHLRDKEAEPFTDRAAALLKLCGLSPTVDSNQAELLSKAEQLCKEARIRKGKDPLTHRTLGCVYALGGKFIEAGRELDEAIKINAHDADSYAIRRMSGS